MELSKREQTRQNYLEAFWDLYQKKPITSISIGELSKAAGYNRSTFYDYFLDIYDVLEQLEAQVSDTFIHELNHFAIFHQKLDELSMMTVDGFPIAYCACEKYLDVLLSEQGDPTYAGKLYQRLRMNFKEELSEHSPSYEYLMEYVFFALMAMLPRWNNNNRPVPLDALMQPILAAISTGQELITK